MNLSKKKRIIVSLSGKLEIDISHALESLENPSKSDIPLNKIKKDGISYPNELQFARDFSLLRHIDNMMKFPEGAPVTLYRNQSDKLLVEFIEEYSKEKHPTEDMKYYQQWADMLKQDIVILPLFGHVMSVGMEITDKTMLYAVMDMLEDAKTFVLSYKMNPTDHSIFKYKALGFIPQSPFESLATLLKGQGITELKTPPENCIIIALYKTLSSIEMNTWILRDLKSTRELLGEYVIYRGLSEGNIKRNTNITYLCKDDKCKTYDRSFDIFGDQTKFEYAYVIETLGGDMWRFLCPYIGSPKLSSYRVRSLLAYLTKETGLTRIDAYNRNHERIMSSRMCFSRTVKPNIEFLESLAQDANMASVKHNLIVALEKEMNDVPITDAYHTLAYVQNMGIKDTILKVLSNEFKELIQYDEFKQLLDQSSFPTSEIFPSYLIEMQKLAQILARAIISKISDALEQPITNDIILACMREAIDEKIKQEGSIMSVVNMKARLLYIDQIAQ
jgi:hypothetical protein